MTAIRHIGKNEFEQSLSTGLCLVDFCAAWCAPCRRQSGIIDQWCASGRAPGELQIFKVDIEREPELARICRVEVVPTLLVYKDGVAVSSAIGVQSEEQLLELLGIEV